MGEGEKDVRLPSDEELVEVLSAQQDSLTQVDKAAFNASLTLGKLGAGVEALSNHKCPGLPPTNSIKQIGRLWVRYF